MASVFEAVAALIEIGAEVYGMWQAVRDASRPAVPPCLSGEWPETAADVAMRRHRAARPEGFSSVTPETAVEAVMALRRRMSATPRR